MIDYIKFAMPSKKYKDQFLDNEEYEFVSSVKKSTGEELGYYIGKYKSLKLEVNSHSVTISGSIHKFYNEVMGQGYQNFDDFSYVKLEEAISIIQDELHVDLNDSRVQNLEFGVNIKIDRCPTNFLKENLILMKYKEPKIEDFNYKGHFREFEFSQYYMKVYNKGAQYGIGDDVLRLEVKTKKSEIFNDYIVAVTDLLDKSNLLKLKSLLMRRVGELLICDTIVPEEVVDNRDLDKFNHYWNPKYWMQLKKENRRKANRGIKDFRSLMQRYDYESLHQGIIRSVSNKYDDLLGYRELEASDVIFDTNV